MNLRALTGVISLLAFVVFRILWFTRCRPFMIRADDIKARFDQIGGWSASSVGASYGKGYELPVLAKWMNMLED